MDLNENETNKIKVKNILLPCKNCFDWTPSMDVRICKNRGNIIFLQTICKKCENRRNDALKQADIAAHFPKKLGRKLLGLELGEDYLDDLNLLAEYIKIIFDKKREEFIANRQTPKEEKKEKKEKLTTEKKINRCIKFLSKQGYSVTLE